MSEYTIHGRLLKNKKKIHVVQDTKGTVHHFANLLCLTKSESNRVRINSCRKDFEVWGRREFKL